jgi:hypothetical protein
MATKYTKWPWNGPNGHKIYQHFQLQDPPRFSQIGIFGLKTNKSGNPGCKPNVQKSNCENDEKAAAKILMTWFDFNDQFGRHLLLIHTFSEDIKTRLGRLKMIAAIGDKRRRYESEKSTRAYFLHV